MAEETDTFVDEQLPVPSGTGGGVSTPPDMSAPIVFDTTPTVPPATLGTTAAVPVPDGREPTALASSPAVAASVRVPGAPIVGDAAFVAANPATVSPGVDAEKEKKIGKVISDNLADAWRDLFSTTKEALSSALAYYSPLIARQAMLESTATDDAGRRLAAGHRRHLEGQALMRAGEYGIPLQQRQELRFLSTISAAINIATKALA